ncbi:MAG: YceD family protein [Bryobacteraceae bacterium]
MFLSVREMEIRKVHFDESFELGRIDFSAEQLRQVGALEASGTAVLLHNTGGQIRVKGRLRVRMEADCDRCLTQTAFEIDQPFDLFYKPESAEEEAEEVEIDEGEAEIGYYEGLGLQLEDLLHEQILLALPMQRVCRESCLGICPICGANRNEKVCDCEEKPVDDRWGALRDIKVTG